MIFQALEYTEQKLCEISQQILLNNTKKQLVNMFIQKIEMWAKTKKAILEKYTTVTQEVNRRYP